MDLITLNLKETFARPGCPLCRISREMERRYLFHLLYEGMNDHGVHAHLVRSLGLCPRHAWAAQATALERFASGTAVAILYEDLVGRLRSRLSGYLSIHTPARACRRTRLRRWLEKKGRLGYRLASRLFPDDSGQWLAAALSPSVSCRACEKRTESEDTYVDWLVQQAATPEFRAWYAASDGLCLPHLRRALSRARDEEVVRFLAQETAGRLASVEGHLAEFLRKRDWKTRDEPRYPWEEASWTRAVAFFAGEADEERDGDVYRVRREALIDYHTRPDRVVGREGEDALKIEGQRSTAGEESSDAFPAAR